MPEQKSKVKNPALAEQGFKQIEWAEQQMQGLLEIRKRFLKEKPLKGLKIGMALHITKETAVLVKTLVAGGAKIAISGCNPLSTQDGVAAALAEEGKNGSVLVYGWRGETTEEYYDCLNSVLNFEPNITIDDGCDLVFLIHTKRSELLKKNILIGGCEETTTGVNRLRAMEKDNALKYPIVAINDSKTKHLVDNFYGTGQSTIDGILRATNILLAGKNFVVCGYGPCGKGLAARASGLGANVIITEIDSFRALQAHFDGFRVMPMDEACKIGDIFVTVTGNKNVINFDNMKQMKDGTILANAGHFDAEIDVSSLKKNSSNVRHIRTSLDEYTIANGKENKKIYLLGEGRLVNLAAAEGHPSLVMSFSFSNQALACEYIAKNRGKLETKVHTMPSEIDDLVSRLHLSALGIKFDSLTKEQKHYLESWKEGT